MAVVAMWLAPPEHDPSPPTGFVHSGDSIVLELTDLRESSEQKARNPKARSVTAT
jgi:hypothetical protein